MYTATFRVGDRVKARTSGFVPAGTLGTIQSVLHPSEVMYYVEFTDRPEPRLMHPRDLEDATTTGAGRRSRD